ncbi:MAG: MaoC family dehydratase [Acidimicrobiia bacterium]
MTTTVVKNPAALAEAVGTHLGWSPWRTVDQPRIQLFADATDDHQWIHLDPDRAAQGPFGQTIAHGFLTLSLAPALLFEVLEVQEASLVVNYGLNKVRFPAPVLSGAKVRMGVELAAVDEIKGGVQATMSVVFEAEGQAKPVCVAEFVFRYLG